MGKYLFKLRRFLLHNVLHTDDSPHAIAFGVAIATVVTFLPLVGFQTAIAIGLAALCRANKAVCIPIVWITNPFTIVPIYGACLKLGQWVTASAPATVATEVLSQLDQQHATARFYESEFWVERFSLLLSLGQELWIGCLIVGVFLALVSYVVSHRGVIAYRERRRKKILRRSLLRTQRQQRARVSRRGEPG